MDTQSNHRGSRHQNLLPPQPPAEPTTALHQIRPPPCPEVQLVSGIQKHQTAWSRENRAPLTALTPAARVREREKRSLCPAPFVTELVLQYEMSPLANSESAVLAVSKLTLSLPTQHTKAKSKIPYYKFIRDTGHLPKI